MLPAISAVDICLTDGSPLSTMVVAAGLPGRRRH